MKITKTAWSKKRKNQLINFYALEPDSKGNVVIYNPLFSWNSTNDALSQINADRTNRKIPAYKGLILHVVFDMSSGRLYLPDKQNKELMNTNASFSTMYDAIRLKIEKLIDIIPLAEPVRGDPLSTIRVRKIKDFYSVSDFIRKQIDTADNFERVFPCQSLRRIFLLCLKLKRKLGTR